MGMVISSCIVGPRCRDNEGVAGPCACIGGDAPKFGQPGAGGKRRACEKSGRRSDDVVVLTAGAARGFEPRLNPIFFPIFCAQLGRIPRLCRRSLGIE